MSNSPTTPTDHDRFGMTAEDRRRLVEQSEDEIMAAALADTDAQPATLEQLARAHRPLVKVVRHGLHLSREEFAASYGIPVAKQNAWERREFEPTETEAAFLRVIAREPERTKVLEPA